MFNKKSQYSKRILSVVKLRTCLRILDHDARRNVSYTHTGLDLVHILSAGSARAICVPLKVSGIDFNLDRIIDQRIHEDRRECRLTLSLSIERRNTYKTVDSALLNGGPGVYSARYGGEGLDDKGRYQLLLNNLRGQSTRAAHFACAIACAFPSGETLTAEGRCNGTIAFAPMGEGGFGYDPVFFVPEKAKTFSQLTAEEKNEISHRGKALEEFAKKLETYLKK